MPRDYKTIIDDMGVKLAENEELMNSLTELRAAYEEQNIELERLRGLPRYEKSDVEDTDGIKWSEKYDNMRRMYRNRFFSSGSEAISDQEEDVAKDDSSTKLTFDDLFKDRESDYNK